MSDLPGAEARVNVLTIDRVLPIEGTYNFRDVGGYPALDGRRTRRRMLYRSDALHRLTPAAQASLLNLGVRTIVDLRFPAECASAPCVFQYSQGLQYRAMPLFEDPRRIARATVPELDAIYRLIVDTRQAQLVGILEALSTPGALPAVVNCTAGKDRTGVVIAAILSLLGVPSETIVEDFAASGPLLADSDLPDTVRARVAASGGDPAMALRLLASPPEHMQRLLDYVDVTYGGVESLLRQAGLSLEQIERLRALLLE